MNKNNDIATQLREDIASANSSGGNFQRNMNISAACEEISHAADSSCLQIADACVGLEDIQSICHNLALRSGWWDEYQAMPQEYCKHFIAGKMALVHSEVSEGLEGFRKSLMDDHLPHRPMVEVEMADAIIRILDLAGALNLDVAGALIEKLAYNQRRPDHKPEARAAEGGKSL